MKKIPAVILFLFGLSISLSHSALATDSPRPVAQAPVEAADTAKLAAQSQAVNIDNLRIQVAVLERTRILYREVDALRSQFAAHDTYIDRLIYIAGFVATLLGALFALVGFIIRRETKEAINEAKEAANEAKKEAAELHKETLRIHGEAKTKLEKVDEMLDQLKQKSTDMLELAKNMKAIEKEITESGEKPSAEIINGLQK